MGESTMISGERILIIGGTGSLGNCLMKRMSDNNKMIIYSRDELKQWEMKKRYPKAKFIIGDIRDKISVRRMIKTQEPDIIIIASALKHVDVCELNPQESLKTNVIGTENVLLAVEELNIKTTVMFVSTDKACAPVNVYGMCKSLAERLVSERVVLKSNAKFLSVRYGNVICSRGSIIPLFMKQAKDDTVHSFTVTSKEMTRFFMTLDESVDLIQNAIKNGESGDLWIPRIRAAKIYDLAEIFSKRFGKPIKYIGIRPGEKIHESLINVAESIRTIQSGNNYIVKSLSMDLSKSFKSFEFTSNDTLISREDLESFLVKNNVFYGVNEI